MGQGKAYSIEVKNIEISFGDFNVLKGISLKMEKGRFYGILGPNGSGKTTLLRSMAKALRPQKGAIFVDGEDISRMKARELSKKIACLYQSTGVSCDYPVMDVVLMGRYPYVKRFQTESAKDREIAKKAMIASNVWHLKDRRINEISGGERQRVFIARALVQETDIVLLDEPISHLDIQHQIEILELAGKMAQEGKTIIAVLHDLNLASMYCDHLIMLKDGTIVAQGEPQKVLTEEIVKKVYGVKPFIIDGVSGDRPYILPLKNQKV
ncbi:MAG TPA: heme ABC transporter ATP-binding protein [Acetivibrio sp.]|uniref:heme ABC transporter ATP-binding protein n=1 Tax=Acetivibrio sp. TaxID=1872092 RepID=UPI002C5DD286|nr:heme ABC transporter ATP-binding protein [Acetivibrio sp.]HOM01469.1 heme ABC transporter ATP-binding protein [Acetivibrio sp.]